MAGLQQYSLCILCNKAVEELGTEMCRSCCYRSSAAWCSRWFADKLPGEGLPEEALKPQEQTCLLCKASVAEIAQQTLKLVALCKDCVVLPDAEYGELFFRAENALFRQLIRRLSAELEVARQDPREQIPRSRSKTM